uniref:Uncharacterized protein n=1 Tax=Mucochytrium quahogii TaxID=96639 RepID=A0A7S2SQY4_9STRA|mmetsp:Transcript_9746/g.18213  ORF Transcript_9746/g.18213 Transcript_9746/m.18213 type:complete len:812 (+) Transcript_9746:257-2692(+)|eukprot:CAMPEP_0203749998 /NCGR_PEP_ID=MMETSP0098-20131031/4315_1 /ASSEMBLY_ACC=CAM_ASM_000208 /TAXON_ID=96639 /ORGANISM=" , Strain NY0313808BC1" /LENGTH=811 /DNA_ID=CAMNT_0050639121 /DNA_START=185 /DNA_END=2620 /DNA_ORIENTATION=+
MAGNRRKTIGGATTRTTRTRTRSADGANLAKAPAKSAKKTQAKKVNVETPAKKAKVVATPARSKKLETPAKKTKVDSPVVDDNEVEKLGAKRRSRAGSPFRARKHAKSTPTGSEVQYNVHRCRFVDWVPGPIMATSANGNGSQLAVTRKGGSFEVWDINGVAWNQKVFVTGQDEDSLENTVVTLCWLESHGVERLFSADLDGNVFEVDLRQQCRSDHVNSFGGAVWCMDGNSTLGLIALGCEDGRVRLMEPQEGTGSGLDYLRSLKGSASGRILALKWHPDQVNQQDVLFTGGLDGLIRRWDSNSGQVTLNIATETYGKQDPICVWSLAVLNDSTVFSGDSEGHIHVWDGKENTGTLLKSFHEHRADVTTLVASKDGSRVFGSGMDSRVAMFRVVKKISDDGEEFDEWVYGYSHRPHSHDVRALALVNDGKTLVSGGNDTQLCWYPVEEFNKARPVKLSPFRHDVLVNISEQVDPLMLVQHSYHVDLWRVKSQSQLLSLKFNGRLGIRCSALSSNGELIAIGDDNGMKIFYAKSPKSATEPLSLKRIDTPSLLPRQSGAPVVCSFSKSGGLLACGMQSGAIHLLRICSNKKKSKGTNEAPSIDLVSTIQGLGKNDKACLKKILLSPDGQWLACGDSSGTISMFSVDTEQQHAEISRAVLDGSSFSSFAFQPSQDASSPVLVVACMDNKFFLYDVERRKLVDGSRRFSDHIDKKFLSRRDCIIGIAFDPKNPQQTIFWGRTFITRVDFSSKPDKLDDEDTSTLALSVLTRYRPIIDLGFTSDGEMIVIEAQWLKVMKTFEDPIYRRRYGGGN